MLAVDFFKRRKFNIAFARAFGFVPTGKKWTYTTPLAAGRLVMQVTVSPTGEVTADVTDPKTGAPYVLHTVARASGKFVGAVKQEYEAVLHRIAAQCFEADVFQSRQAAELITYARSTYGGELEYLWKQFPDNAVWRRADNHKWYGALLIIPPQKLGLPPGNKLEILDVRMTEEQAARIDHTIYFPGYHMNKKHWMTVKLDGSLTRPVLQHLIDVSYQLAGK